MAFRLKLNCMPTITWHCCIYYRQKGIGIGRLRIKFVARQHHQPPPQPTSHARDEGPLFYGSNYSTLLRYSPPLVPMTGKKEEETSPPDSCVYACIVSSLPFFLFFLYLFRGCVCAWVYMWGYTVVAAASNKRSTESHRPVENTTFPSRSLVKSRVIVFGFSPPLCHTRKKSRPDSVQRMAHTGSFGFALFSSSLFPDLCGSYFLFVCSVRNDVTSHFVRLRRYSAHFLGFFFLAGT